VSGSDIDAAVAAWAQAVEAMIALGGTFTDVQWRAHTECPGWTVKDVYAHLVGGELWMAEGHPASTAELATIAERPVAARRDVAGAAVLDELSTVYAVRRHQLATAPEDPAAPTLTAYGAPVTVGVLYRHRAFDAWVHEQDVRRAVGRPGNLDTAGALIARDILLAAIPRVVAKLAAAPPGSTVRLTVTGPVTADATISVDDNRRGHLGPPAGGTPTAAITMAWETFGRLAAGRIRAGEAETASTGDVALADRILDHFAVTP
jgi:uncharacterized protein (TIGR03083 family)